MNKFPFIALCLTTIFTSSSGVRSKENIIAETNRPDINTFVIGDTALLYIRKNSNDANQIVHVSIVDEKEASIFSENVTFKADKTSGANQIIKLPTQKFGFYKIYLSASDGASLAAAGTRPAGFVSYIVVQDPKIRHDYGASLSRFGLQGPMSADLPVLPFLGVRYVLRGVMHDWAREEKSPGQFTSSGNSKVEPNEDIETNLKYQSAKWHLYPVAIMVGSVAPKWAFSEFQKQNDCQFGPLTAVGRDEIKLYADRISKEFTLYRPGDIHYYQVTWEPFAGHCFLGTTQELLEIYKLTYARIHANDPKAIVSGPTLNLSSDSTSQIRSLSDGGLAKYIDAISLHAYNPSGGEEAVFPPEKSDMLVQLNRQRSIIGAPNKKVSDFIDTEHAFRSVEVGDLNKAEGDVRVAITMLGEGASIDFGFYLYDFWPGNDISKNKGYGFYWNLDGKNYGATHISPKPIAAAFSAMTWMLDGTISGGTVDGLLGSQRGYRFVRNGMHTSVIWDFEGKSTYAPRPGFSRICDWMGNCEGYSGQKILVGPTPTYLVE